MSQPMSSPDVNHAGATPPQRSDRYAWIFALLPLAGFLEFVYGAITHNDFPNGAATGMFIGAYIGVASADVLTLKQAQYSKLPNRWWCILPPAYLIARARALGRGWALLGVWIATFAVFVLFTLNIGMFGSGVTTLLPTPSCDGDVAQTEVLRIFQDIPQVQQSKLHAVRLTEAAETGLEGKRRSCRAQVLTDVATSARQAVTYTFTRRDDGQVFLEVKLAP